MPEKIIVVTGCTRGIGRAVCDLFISKGFHIAGYARNLKDLNDMRAVYARDYPQQEVLLEQADATIKASVDKFAGHVVSKFGKVDILLNNAGYFLPGSIMKEPEGTLETMMATNVYSAYHITRALAGSVKQHIVNMCSIASLDAYEAGASYTISKFAMLGFSKQLRQELIASGIKVTSILPGAVKTDSWKDVDLPDSRFVQAGDIAETIFTVCCSLSAGADIEEIVIRPQQGDI